MLDSSLVDLWGGARDAAPVYGSGGFTNHDVDHVARQLAGWVDRGIPRVKMKVGRDPGRDPARVAAVREVIGDTPALMVDANGAHTVQQAVRASQDFADSGVVWHEEPVSSDDRDGLARVRRRSPAGMDVAAGEYGWDAFRLRDLLEAGAVDCLQADVTRCGGFTGWFDAAGLAWAHQLDLSAHCAPNLAAHAGCATRRFRHLEWFHDHVRIESVVLRGGLEPIDGALRPDRDRPGHGLELDRSAADQLANGRPPPPAHPTERT
nr:enolase C-terminal domain-like protein [Salsipaludibacter albus]